MYFSLPLSYTRDHPPPPFRPWDNVLKGCHMSSMLYLNTCVYCRQRQIALYFNLSPLKGNFYIIYYACRAGLRLVHSTRRRGETKASDRTIGGGTGGRGQGVAKPHNLFRGKQGKINILSIESKKVFFCEISGQSIPIYFFLEQLARPHIFFWGS